MCIRDRGLVAERQQLFNRAAAAGDDDDVDLGSGIEIAQRLADLGDGRGALHRHLANVESDGGPAPFGVFHHVTRSSAVATCDESDHPGQEWQRPFAARIEQALRCQPGLEDLDPGQQIADTDRTDRSRFELQSACLLYTSIEAAVLGTGIGHLLAAVALGQHDH